MMTYTDTQQAIREIMESLGENIEFDQLINKLADKNIITTEDVTRINALEDKEKMKELVIVILGKDSGLHPLALRILETLKSPSAQNSRRTDQAIEQAGGGSGTVSKPLSERRILTNAEVSEDWALKNFLFDLAKEIGPDEFDDMKDLMRGESGFGAASLDKMKRPMQFFNQLVNTGRLNSYNLHFLQALVRRIGRKDLNDKVRQFCLESNEQPIHFFTPSETPENGYRFVKHHIEGNIEKLTHFNKERLRTEVANVLCVPPTFVFIKGIEPTDSILFTFMVPEEDVSSFIHMYVTEKASFIHLTVEIQIHGDQLSLSEMPPQEDSVADPMFYQLKRLLEKEQSLQDQLEERDVKLLDLQTELDSKEGDTVDQVLHEEDLEQEGDTQELRQECELYKSLFYRMMEVMKTMQPRVTLNGVNGLSGSLKLSSASTLYRKLLQQLMQHCSGIDVDLVNKLLDTRALVENIQSEDRLNKMQSIIGMMNQRIEELREMNGFMRMSSSIIGGSTFLQDMLAVQAHNRNLAIEQQKEEDHGVEISGIIGVQVVERICPVNIKLQEELQQRLVMMTNDLTQKERNKLKNFLCFSEAEKEELERDPDKLLELAVLSELRKGTQEPLDIILGRILAKIKKGSMVQRYFIRTESPPKVIARRGYEKRRSKRMNRSETPQRVQTDSETCH